jgi:bifunctional enzyme CysN/CysC
MHGAPPASDARTSILRLCFGRAPADRVAPLLNHLFVAGSDSFSLGKRTLVLARSRSDELDAAVGAATADVCLILAEPRSGLSPEVRRQAAIACTAGVRHLVLVVDLPAHEQWNNDAQATLSAELAKYTAPFHPASTSVIPVSTADGGNIAAPGTRTPWYAGPTLLSYLETLVIDPDRARRGLRLFIGKSSGGDAGQNRCEGVLACGTLRRGDTVLEALSGARSQVARIFVDGAEAEQAEVGAPVSVALAGDIVARPGDLLVDAEHRPQAAEQFAAHLTWMGAEPLLPGREYTLKMGTRLVGASVTAVKHRIDVDSLQHIAARTLKRDEIGACALAVAAPIPVDDFASFPQSGRFVLSEPRTGATIAAGTVDFALRRGVNVHMQPLAVSRGTRATLKAQGPCVVWFTGLSGAGKSTIANLVEGRLAASGHHTYLLDGDNVRHGLNKDLGFTAADRVENIRRVGEVAKLFVDAGLIVLCSFISPFRAERLAVRNLMGEGEFIEVYVQTPLQVCEERDPKGLYAKCRAGRLPNFTGIDSPYEAPEAPDLVLDTTAATADELAQRVTALLQARGLIAPPTPKLP